MLEVFGGAVENVNIFPTTVYVFFCWYAPLINTKVAFSLNGAAVIVYATVEPLPVKLLTKIPKAVCTYITSMVAVFGGAVENVNVTPDRL
jgi:hypothetical protein